MKYYLSIGSNINPESNINFAISKLEKIFSKSEQSTKQQTKPEGFEGDDFINLVYCGNCELAFNDLNDQLKRIEDLSGRDRNVPKFSSRTLDVDIILQLDDAGKIIFKSNEIAKYNFVSEPLNELI